MTTPSVTATRETAPTRSARAPERRVAHATREPQVEYPRFDGNAFPHLALALLAGGPERDQETFEAGLELVLDAIERRCQ